jgi:hypothetical protein
MKRNVVPEMWRSAQSVFVYIRSRRSVRAIAVAIVCLIGLAVYIASLGKRYPIADWLFWRLLVIWGWCALLHGACLVFGHLILSRWLKVRDRPLGETLVTCVAVGMVAFTVAMYLAGALALYRTWVAIALPIGMLAAGGPSLVDLARAIRANRKTATAAVSPWSGPLGGVAVVVGAIFVGLVYLQCMTPEALNYDSRWYHLAIAQDYAREGRIVPFPADYNKAFPHLASIVHTWGWLLPGLDEPLRWMLALHNEFCLFLWALAGVGATTAWLVERVRVKGAWAAFFLFPVIFVYDSNLGGGSDHFVAFFAAPAFLAAVRAARDLSPRHSALVGVLTAGAVLSKYQAMYLLVPIAIMTVGRWLWLSLVSAREAEVTTRLSQIWRAGHWRGPLAMLAVGILLTAPHFLKNWIFYHNPLYPFMTATFSGSRPRQPDSPILVMYLLTGDSTIPRGPLLERISNAVSLAFTFSFRDQLVIGSLFTLLLPVILFLRGQRRLWIGAIFSLLALLTWAFTYPVDRYLQCIFPIIAGVTAAVIIRAWELGWIARAGLVALVGFQLVWGGDIPFRDGESRLADALRLIRSGSEKGARTRFDRYLRSQIAVGHRLPSNAIVLFHNTRLSLGVNRTVLQDLPGYQGLIDYRGVRTPRDLCQLYRSYGITHIVHERSVWPALSKQEEVVFAAFLARFAPNTFHEGEYEVVEIPNELPPQEVPYQSLMLGLDGYADGVYPIDALGIYEPLPERFKQWPLPALPVTLESAGLPAVIDHVNAAVISSQIAPSSQLETALREKFINTMSFRDRFTVWIRRTSL